ncbi:MAG: zinc ribbon domain-containing protein [Deltaproteobacteria bacterium]|nr:zinc ribbon domain-containing protein [Deltaproteobacteria bacterium]
METKQDVLERILSQEKPVCPHCNREMDMWEVPPIAVGDGLGWDSPYLFVCFNDKCPLYVSGWDNLMENYAQHASYRCIKSPNDKHFEMMPVFSSMGGQGQVVNEQVLADQERLKESIKKGFSILADCFVSKDVVTVMQLLLDPAESVRVRVKAAEMMGDIGGIDAIDLLASHRFGHDRITEMAKSAVARIHERNFTRECPFCAEIIKKRANLCKHCGKEVAGV